MSDTKLQKSLQANGISRRGFLKYCSMLASSMALAPSMVPRIAEALENAKRPSVIWLSFQECTGCVESLTRSGSPTIESLIFNTISLDYQHTLQVASGNGAELSKEQAIKENFDNYLLVVDGSIPLSNPGYSTIAGESNLDILEKAAKGAAAIVAVGTCAAFCGLPKAHPNPTGAVSVTDIITDKPIVNVPGCPPIPSVITGTLAQFLIFGKLPEMDSLNRPLAYYGQNIHDRCYRRPFYERGQFADSFDDEGAKKGWCLYKLGCKGPTTYNACAVQKWNDGTSFPIQSGHGCLGCSEPDFWDFGSFYSAISEPAGNVAQTIAAGTLAGLAAGAALGALNKKRQKDAAGSHKELKVGELTTGDES